MHGVGLGWVVSICVERTGDVDGIEFYLVEDFLPYKIRPMRSDWGEEKSLEFDVSEDEILVHAYARSSCGFPVEISCAGEIVQG